MSGEIWKDIPGFEGLYQASDRGNIRSYDRGRGSGKILRPFISKKYLHVNLSNCNFRYRKAVARLVAETFIPNPENKPQVNHKDGNKLNNIESNLEWSTASEQQIHASHMGLLSRTRKRRLTDHQMIEIKDLVDKGRSQTIVAKQYGVSDALIWLIVHNKMILTSAA